VEVFYLELPEDDMPVLNKVGQVVMMRLQYVKY